MASHGPVDRDVPLSEAERVRAAYAKRPSNDPRYSWLQPGHLFMVQGRERQILATLARHKVDLRQLRVLDVGCGDGYWLRELVKWGVDPSRLVGVDLIANRLHNAARLTASQVALLGANGTALPFPDAAFDLVVQSTVFSSILDSAIREQVAGEILRVLRPGGHVLWYDFYIGNPRNPDVRRVSLEDIRHLFPGCQVDVRRATLAPPIARMLAGVTWTGCTLLEMVPWLRTHYAGLLTKF